MLTFTGSIKSIKHYNEGDCFCAATFLVDAKGSPEIQIVGTLSSPKKGAKMQISGDWTSHPKYGAQFKIASFSYLQPDTNEGIVGYLGSGLIKGLGPSLAEKIVTRFGAGTFDVLDHHPEMLKEVPGIGAKKLESIVTEWKEHRGMSEAIMFLQSHGIASTLAVKIFKYYKDLTISVVKANPYKLAEDIWGIGFETADQIAGKMGIALDSPDRVTVGVLYVLQQKANVGHTCMPTRSLISEAVKLLKVTEEAAKRDIERLVQMKKCFRDQVTYANSDRPEEAIYMAGLFRDETGIVSQLRRIIRHPSSALSGISSELVEKMIAENPLALTEAQKQAVRNTVLQKVSGLSGGPGCGKTTTLATIVRICKSTRHSVLLVSPTGRAAKRLEESTGSEASTIHRALGFSPDGEGFLHNRDNPLEGDIIVIDEASMLDTFLACSLLKAVKSTSHVLLVGDPDQLPSVGPGNVLKDIISSGAVPFTILTEVKRQAAGSAIISNAHLINKGQPPVISKDLKDFFFLEVQNPDNLGKVVGRIVTQWVPANFGVDPLHDCQVLAPMRRGPAGITLLNEVLREAQLPVTEGMVDCRVGSSYFRQGDKVLQVRNNYKLGVMNGDIGFIDLIDKNNGRLRVRFDDERPVVYEFIEIDQLTPAYCISIHKSQGSESPVIVVVIDKSHQVMLQRNLIYTGITRAKQACIIVGSWEAVMTAVKNDHLARRFTGLAARLRRQEVITKLSKAL